MNVIFSLRFQFEEMRSLTLTYAKPNQGRRRGANTQNQAPPPSDGASKPVVVFEPGFTATPLNKLQAMDLLTLYHHYLKWVLSLLLRGRESQTVKEYEISEHRIPQVWDLKRRKGNSICVLSLYFLNGLGKLSPNPLRTNQWRAYYWRSGTMLIDWFLHHITMVSVALVWRPLSPLTV